MLDYTKFHDVFPADLQIPYDRKLQHEIEDHRKNLDGTLFIDRVSKALRISKAYPPKSDTALRQLHKQICDASMSMHHKQSLLYYVLLDFDVTGSQSISEDFAFNSGMPSNYQVFMKGLWYLDRQDYEKALEYVAHPSLSPDFADDIIITLVRHARDGLALSYYYAVQPILKTSLALELLFDAMARTNVTDALFFSRTYPQHTRENLFRRWIASILDSGPGQEASGRLSELAFMPLDSAEEAWLEEYLSVGEGRNLKRAKDTLLIRKIASDRFADIGKYKANGQWAAVLEGIKHGVEGHAE